MGRRLKVVALGAALAMVLSSCIWPEFHYGPERTGFNPSETKISLANVGTLELKWTGSAGSGVLSSPAVVNGTVYVTSVSTGLKAFSAAGTTGCSGTPKVCTPLWTAPMGGFGGSSPAVANGVVYVASHTELPSFPLTGQFLAFDAAGSTGCSGTPKVCTPLWTADSPGLSNSPTVVEGKVLVGSDGLRGFDPAGVTNCSGTPKVCQPVYRTFGNAVTTSVAVGNGIAYSFNGGVFGAYDATGATCSGSPVFCSPKWTFNLGPTESSPSVGGSLVYIGADDAKVRAFTTAATFPQCSGTPKVCNPKWTFTTGGQVKSSPAVANGVVYVGSIDGKLYALDAATGALLWSAATGGEVRSSPAVANGVVYVGSDAGKLLAYDAGGVVGCSGTPKVCTPQWSVDTGTPVDGSPVVVNGTVVFGDHVGNVYSYGLPA